MSTPKRIYYNPKLKELAREFRNNPTLSEKLFWQRLKNKQIMGYDFHRQKPIGNYIVDFYCFQLMLAIEIDGLIHQSEDVKFRDYIRQDKIEDYGLKFLRFSDKEVENNINGVIMTIEDFIVDFEMTHPPNPPLNRGGIVAIPC